MWMMMRHTGVCWPEFCDEGYVSSVCSGDLSPRLKHTAVVDETMDGTTRLDLMDDLATLELSQPIA